MLWEGLEKMSPLLWWRRLRGTNILDEVALCVLNAPITSAATTRTFDVFSWIHSQKRNRLTSDELLSLHISYNWKPLNDDEEIKKKQKLDLIDEGKKE